MATVSPPHWTSWSTGWISREQQSLKRARRAPTVSSLTQRSVRRTSGLFNTGFAGDSSEITSEDLSTIADTQPGPSSMSMSADNDKFVAGCHDDFLADTFQGNDDDFNMDMFGDLSGVMGVGGDFDPLGDASLDSFTDLSALLTEENNAFLDSLTGEDPASMMPDFNNVQNAKPSTMTSIKRSFDQMEAAGCSSDLDALTAQVGLTVAASNLDHDYSSKRPRVSTAAEEPAPKRLKVSTVAEELVSVEVKEVFLPPPTPTAPSPGPSTSYIGIPKDKTRNRREKNNVASKRSREIRKRKFADMEGEADRLIDENARLEKRVVELERLAKQMKEILVAKMAGK